MELVLWLILIAIGIVFMFSIVINAVKFIKTDKIHDTAREKKLRERQLEEELDKNNKVKVIWSYEKTNMYVSLQLNYLLTIV